MKRNTLGTGPINFIGLLFACLNIQLMPTTNHIIQHIGVYENIFKLIKKTIVQLNSY